jgi:hypothetical protein
MHRPDSELIFDNLYAHELLATAVRFWKRGVACPDLAYVRPPE